MLEIFVEENVNEAWSPAPMILSKKRFNPSQTKKKKKTTKKQSVSKEKEEGRKNPEDPGIQRARANCSNQGKTIYSWQWR